MRIVSGDPKMIVDRVPGDGYSVRLSQDEMITAKITGKFVLGTTTFYQWQEVRALLDGSGYEALSEGRTGDNVSNYAAEMNGSSSVPNDTIVVLRPRIIADTSTLSGSGQIVSLLEFQYSSGGGGSCSGNAVSAVQCVGNVLYVTYGGY